MIFEGSALNRDEKIGNNILSIKKMNINGKTKSYIGKPALRHYLFETLQKAFSDNNKWKASSVTSHNKVIQFDLSQDDILTSAELDAFGYMYTISGNSSFTRKSPVGIIKAVSLSNYEQDISLYANHDLVNRANQRGMNVFPNPYNKEEHTSFYKVTLTIDSEIFGSDFWISNSEPFSDNNILNIEIGNPAKYTLEDVGKNEDEDVYKINGNKIVVNENEIVVDKNLMTERKIKNSDNKELIFTKPKDNSKDGKESNNKAKGRNEKKSNFIVHHDDYEYNEDDKTYKFCLSRVPKYDEEKKTLTIETGAVKEINFIGTAPNNYTKNKKEFDVSDSNKVIVEKIGEKGPYKIQFKLNESTKKERIQNILNCFKNGLYAQSSGEANSIVPLFMIASAVKIPSPVFHSYIDLRNENCNWIVIGISDCLKNMWVEGKIYIQDSERIRVELKDEKISNNWENFLAEIENNAN